MICFQCSVGKDHSNIRAMVNVKKNHCYFYLFVYIFGVCSCLSLSALNLDLSQKTPHSLYQTVPPEAHLDRAQYCHRATLTA